MNWDEYMKIALEEAKISLREGNHGFGAVIMIQNYPGRSPDCKTIGQANCFSFPEFLPDVGGMQNFRNRHPDNL
ncbi:hypothetical protein [Sporomusa acidovorans]|uniref:CMP/dCMP-type deaminase domain-containing protein n=1 Tax=Sporomusa acidovorans (strain ATCC 49682 / DSM 3132 / Mol) TaxID=1123286 RepID=A0ABZ3IYU9_SPOA4|nr:hypothetical protein [Sporomusa acidovorans]OZC14175.1 hypothetical protein SPACI_53500 [Sporomusa acidovorans DSM 3132]SDE70450.1 hypothetical protein SAMN04488499_101971 [Sporomusa acidovorans]